MRLFLQSKCQSSFPPSEPTSDPEGRTRVSFLGYRNRGQRSGGSWGQMGELDHLSYEEVPRAVPGASSQPLPGTGAVPSAASLGSSPGNSCGQYVVSDAARG